MERCPWNSYGEAVGGRVNGCRLTRSGVEEDGKKARARLVRAIMADKGYEADARHRARMVSREYRMLLLEEGKEGSEEVINETGEEETKVLKKGMKIE
jgi:hypothetical protein